MTILSLFLITLICIIIIIYFLAQYVLNEKQLYQLKYVLYAGVIMFYASIMWPVYLFRPRNPINMSITATAMSRVVDLFGIKYRIENADVFDRQGPCVIVANHQSSIDVIGMIKLWPTYIRKCTILVKKELLWAVPFGPAGWLGGLTFINRTNREKSGETLRRVAKKIQNKSYRLWVYPEGTRNMGDTLLPFKYGAFRLAIEAQVPVIPVVFSSYKSIYNADKQTNSYYWRHGCVTIKCLEPIDTTGMTMEKDLHRLTDMTRERMIEAYQTIHTTTDDKKAE